VATRKIPAGRVICCETPLVTCELESEDWDQPSLNIILAAVAKLNQPDRQRYLALYRQTFPGFDKLRHNRFLINVMDLEQCHRDIYTREELDMVEIFKSNGMNISSSLYAIYYMLSRINHSCCPTAVFGPKEEGGQEMVLVAATDIPKNGEVTFNYISSGDALFWLREDRQRHLSEGWQFLCCCSVCSLTGPELERDQQTRRAVLACLAEIRTPAAVSDRAEQCGRLGRCQRLLQLLDSLPGVSCTVLPARLMQAAITAERVFLLTGDAAKAGQSEGYQRRALSISEKLGPAALRNYKLMEQRWLQLRRTR